MGKDYIKSDKEFIKLHDRLHAISSYKDSISDQMWHADYYSGHDWYNSLIDRSDKLYKLNRDHPGELSTNELRELVIYTEEELI